MDAVVGDYGAILSTLGSSIEQSYELVEEQFAVELDLNELVGVVLSLRFGF